MKKNNLDLRGRDSISTCEEEIRREEENDSDPQGRYLIPTLEEYIFRQEGAERSRLDHSDLHRRVFS